MEAETRPRSVAFTSGKARVAVFTQTEVAGRTGVVARPAAPAEPAEAPAMTAAATLMKVRMKLL